MPNKTITCKDCGATFIFSEDDQAFFAEKGYTNEPTRCPDCRAARKQARGNDSSRGYQSNNRNDREMFPAVCAACGKTTTVPFKPSSDKPVYCRDCFQSRRR
jgi:CxxC-x17-CxxC domain-containing protein